MSPRVGSCPSTFNAAFLVAMHQTNCGCGMKSTWPRGAIEGMQLGPFGIKPLRLEIDVCRMCWGFQNWKDEMPAVNRVCILFTILTSLTMLLLPGLITTFIEL
jgi:hypothetical protein